MSITTSYNFHGLGITICGSEAVSAALRSRLKHFLAEGLNGRTMHFEYRAVGLGVGHVVDRPAGAGRSIDDAGFMETIYYDSCDQLYVQCGDQLRVLCDLQEGRVLLSIRDTIQNNVWLVSHPAFTVPFAELLKRSGVFVMHAAGACVNGKAILFAGHSGAGKSTLSLAFLRNGLGYLGDDMVFLRMQPEGMRVLAFPDEIDVTDETIDLFPELHHLSHMPKSPGTRKRQMRAEEFYVVDMISECEPGALVFPTVSGNARSVLSSMDANEAFLELVPNVIRTDLNSSQRHLDVLAALVKQSKCYRLHTGRDFDALPQLLRPLVESQ